MEGKVNLPSGKFPRFQNLIRLKICISNLMKPPFHFQVSPFQWRTPAFLPMPTRTAQVRPLNDAAPLKSLP